MWARKRLDIGWKDLAFGIRQSCLPRQQEAAQRRAERAWSAAGDVLACLSVRSGFDLLLGALRLPPGSEVLVSALTIPDMVRIIEHHGLVPVPLDLDVDSLAPTPERLRQAITPRTRAVLVAHLFGGRMPLGPLLDVARGHDLLLIEDCAQAFAGSKGLSAADVSMYSFGPIKTATALGGAIFRVRDAQLLERMRIGQACYAEQGRGAYLRRLLKYAAMKGLSARPLYGAIVRACRLGGRDHDRLINGLARGFAGPGFFERIRRQPSAALLALLERRLRQFDAHRLADRTARGRLLAEMLQDRVEMPGNALLDHTFWVFPILTDEPERLIARLAQSGFDATRGQSLCVVPPPAGRPETESSVARDVLSRLVFLPLYPKMPPSEVRRLGEAVRICAAKKPETASFRIPRNEPTQAAESPTGQTIGEIPVF